VSTAPSDKCVQPFYSDQVFVRGGLQAVILDSPEHSDWSRTEHANDRTLLSCQRCRVPREQLGNADYNFRANERSAEEINADIAWAKAGGTATERNQRASTRGVAFPEVASPLQKLTFDGRRQLPFDILHQDALWQVHKFRFSLMYTICPRDVAF